jgi:DNA replication protein DnaC
MTKSKEKTAGEHNAAVYEAIGSATAWELYANDSDFTTVSHAMLVAAVADIWLPQVPRRFRQASLYKFPPVLVDQVNTALSAGLGLFVYGKRGRGKTELAAAVIRELMRRAAGTQLELCWQTRVENKWSGEPSRHEVDRYVSTAFSAALNRGRSIVFKNTAELMDDIKACFDSGSTVSKQTIVDRYASAAVLVLDDMGMEKPSAFVQETFDMIVNRRWAEELLTVFTSNLTFDELEKHYDDHGRIRSRIAGMCEVVELVGEDRRLRM